MTSHFFDLADRKILPSYRTFGIGTHFRFMLTALLLTRFVLPDLLGAAIWSTASGTELYAAGLKGQFEAGASNDFSNYVSDPNPTNGTSKSSTNAAIQTAQLSGDPTQSPGDPTQWLIGDAFERKLKNIQSVQWERASLGQILSDAQKIHQLRIWIDRRVDTSQIVTLNLQSQSVGQSLATLAQRCHGEVVFMSPLVIVVPEGTAAQFLVLRANLSLQVDRLPKPVQTSLLKLQTAEWDQFAQPNNLLRQWVASLSESIELAELDSLPHDAWAAGNLPELPLVDRLLLLSFGFGKQFQLDYEDAGLQVRLSDFNDEYEIECLIEDRDWIKTLQAQQTILKKDFPDVLWINKKNKGLLGGKLNEVANVLQRALRPVETQAGAKQDLSTQRFTLSVSQQVAGNILQTIAQQTNLQLVMNATAKEKLKQRIDINAVDLTMEQLLEQVAKATETQIKMQDGQIVVSDAP